MIFRTGVAVLLCIAHVTFLSLPAEAEVKLPRLVRDSMVLQRDAVIKIWGWASAGEKVTIRFNGHAYTATTGPDGKWAAGLAPQKAGGPYTMQITASNRIQLKDILVGDVWLCSGQSNMVHQMELHRDLYAADMEQANYPEIRHFFIPTLTSLQGPLYDLPAGNWKPATRQDLPQFSAVAYFFAKAIYEKYHVPIGLINASVGGTPIEAWTSEKGLQDFPALTGIIQKNKDTAYTNTISRTAAASAASMPRKQLDKGLSGLEKWYDTAYIPKGWLAIRVPGYWEDQGIADLDGAVWYRKVIDLPASMAGMPARIALGRIVDADFLYVNGSLAGSTGYQYPQRRYLLPAGLLKAGKNLLVVRVVNTGGKGGFVPDKPYYLSAGSQTIDLRGDWQYKVGEAYVPGRNTGGLALQNQPAALFNAMVAPLVNYTIKGFLWYQGEANTGNAAAYAQLLPALIADWRSRWQQGDLPFLYVQLPNFMEARYLPAESQWAALRQAQLKTLAVSNTGMAVAIDLGEWNDIHPMNKKDVGVRLALSAGKVAYGEKNSVYSGPVYQSYKIENNKVIIAFNNENSGGLATTDGEEPGGFAIAGADRKFVWATAKIEGSTVVVWNEEIAHPLYVRYAWADNPQGANLYNKEGLPASPFETGNAQAKINR